MQKNYRFGLKIFGTLLLIVLGFSSNAMAQEEQPIKSTNEMSLDDCLKAAMKNNVMLNAARKGVDVYKNQQRSVRGRFLPVVKVEGNVIFWEDSLDLAFFPPELANLMSDPAIQMMLGTLDPANQQLLADLVPGLTQPMTLRDDLTYSGSVTIGQPLTQLYAIYSGYWATGEMTKKADMDAKKAERDIQLAVTDAYYGLIMARKMEKTAEAGLKQVEAYERQVKAFLDAQMVERNALLKVLVQKADIQKGLFQAQKGVKLATAGLNMLMHRPLDTPIVTVLKDTEDVDDNRYAEMNLRDQQMSALENRPDLFAIKYQSEAARAGKHAAIAAMLPEINAFFSYERNEGMGSMSPESVYYGGFTLSWNIWEWGATYYGIKEAEAREQQAQNMLVATNEQVQLDVKKKKLELEEALKNLKVAEAKIEQAQENLRVEQARFEVQETTTTDLLQAQTLSLKAENEYIVAVTKVKSATMALSVAMGEDLIKKR